MQVGFATPDMSKEEFKIKNPKMEKYEIPGKKPIYKIHNNWTFDQIKTN